jgi:simple sugar transport system ATP-binding protein
LREVLAVADRITVLRRGRVVASLPASPEVTEAGLVSLMLGGNEELPGPIGDTNRRTPPPRANGNRPVLSLTNVDVRGPDGRLVLRRVTLDLCAGEIIGVAAIAGNGQLELGDLLVGLAVPHVGEVRIDGHLVRHWTAERALEAGVGCLPEDLPRMAVVGGVNVLEHMILPERVRYTSRTGLSMDWRQARTHVAQRVQNLGFQVPALDRQVDTLSGGNVQRVMFAREASRSPRVLVSFYPTRGLDVPSAEAARATLRRLRNSGTSVVLVSEDLDELFAMSDRLVVMHRGEIVTTTTPEVTSQHHVGLLMTGALPGQRSA